MLNVTLYNKETPNISQRLVVCGHFAQVIFPDVGLESPPSEGFAGDGHDAALFVASRVGASGNDKADLRALLPERAGKFVKQKRREIIASSFGEYLYRIFKAAPRWLNRRLKPFAELKTIAASLADDSTKNFLSGHSIARGYRKGGSLYFSPYGRHIHLPSVTYLCANRLANCYWLMNISSEKVADWSPHPIVNGAPFFPFGTKSGEAKQLLVFWNGGKKPSFALW